MNAKIGWWLIFFVFMTRSDAAEDHQCTLVDDHYGKNLHDSVCYLKCLSDALNRLYTNGEKKLFVNEEAYANASRILDDMEGKAGESTKYLTVISGVVEGKHDKLEKLISYGNEMGDLVARVGGLFSEVHESVRAVRKVLPVALIEANKYYTAIAEVVRTVWDDIKGLGAQGKHECKGDKVKSIGEFRIECGHRTCPLKEGVNEGSLQKYKGGCLQVYVLGGSVNECFNLPRDNLYRSVAAKNSSETLHWGLNGPTYFQLTVKVQKIFTPLITSLSAGQPPSALFPMMSNITSLYSQFNEVHSSFTSLLLDANTTEKISSANFTI